MASEWLDEIYAGNGHLWLFGLADEVMCLKESRKLLAYLETEFGKAQRQLGQLGLKSRFFFTAMSFGCH